jgi:glycerol-3-phosphate dehydrogenase
VSNRGQQLERLRSRQDWPVVIVGAGINGIATFRDLSLQGVDCLLVDRATSAPAPAPPRPG